MTYCQEEAKRYTAEAIGRLAKGNMADRMLHATADKIGFEKVVKELCRYGGVLEGNFSSLNRYSVGKDDLRRVIHSMRSVAVAAERERLRPSFA